MTSNRAIACVSVLSAVLTLGGAGATFAQLPANPKTNPPAPARPPATAQQNPGTPPEVVAPKAEPRVPRGVIHPPPGVDKGIKLPTPPPRQFPMPVIPPPGTKGSGQPNTVPK